MTVKLEQLTDDELIDSLKALVGNERRCVASVLRHLNEFDRRRLAAGRGFPSLFDYCVRELKYAQGEAARRIQSARAAAKYPVLYKAVERGFISLTAVSILAPHLNRENYRTLIRASKGLSTREVEALVASLNPVAVAPVERIRMMAVTSPPPARVDELFDPTRPPVPSVSSELESAPMAAPAEPVKVIRRVLFSFTGDEALLRDYERAKELSRHKWPAGKMEDVFTGAVKALLDKIDPDRRTRRKERARRLAVGGRARGISRAVKDEVWARDGGRCSYRASDGRVCGARAGLEFDHVRPWSRGGPSSAENLRLLCRAHNAFEARRVFGSVRIDAAVRRNRTLRNGVKI